MSFIKDLLFPKICLSCGFIGGDICGECSKKLIYGKTDVCLYCGKPSLYGLTHLSCRKKNGVDGLIYIFNYNNVLRKIIKNIKYKLVQEAVPQLLSHHGNTITEKINNYKKIFPEIIFQPIPLTLHKEKQRGFNQAALILKHLSSLTPLVTCNYLLKIKNTPPQAQMKDKKQRQLNIAGCFQVVRKAPVKNTVIALVDDVVTTGSTVKEAVKVLKNTGAKKVFVVALAKG